MVGIFRGKTEKYTTISIYFRRFHKCVEIPMGVQKTTISVHAYRFVLRPGLMLFEVTW